MNPELSLFPNSTALSPDVWHGRCLSTSYRLLTGLGTSVLVAYREEPLRTLSAIVHGITRSGDVVVAVSAQDPEVSSLDLTRTTDIRLSIDKAAPNFELSVVAASLHLLGKAHWLSEDEQIEMLSHGQLSDRVSEVAGSGHLARIEFERALLHDPCGVTPVTADEISQEHARCLDDQHHALFCRLERDLFSNPELELTAVDVVTDCSIMDAAVLFDGLMFGGLKGAFTGRQDLANACVHSRGVSCLDVDRTGLTLLYIDKAEAVTAFVPFANRVSTRSELVSAIAELHF
ncbi:hypothetical protein [Changpingibacter yushuensis]|uniref:hypothetical protein n=1 Tax=Changpingibacter yushuensis TaxID=2758440 RepID=UPI0015F6EFF4|nr:hypothetical protein [Changpingibacter yushuensis]